MTDYDADAIECPHCEEFFEHFEGTQELIGETFVCPKCERSSVLQYNEHAEWDCDIWFLEIVEIAG